MDLQVLASREPWLEAFFGGANCIRWLDLVGGTSTWGVALSPWLELVAAGRGEHGLLLPCETEDGSVTWHAVAKSRQDRAALAEQLVSFLGPAHIEVQEPTAPGTHDQILVDRFRGDVTHLVARPGTESADVGQTLSVLARLLLRRPVRPREVQRSFAVVWSEFEQALLTADEARARRCIDELRSTGRLSVANERFLQVRLLGALARETTLVQDLGLMSALADAHLPIRVLREVVEALYTVHLAPLGDDAPVEAWIGAFLRHVRRHEGLLRNRRGLRAPAVLRVFLLQEVARPPADIRPTEVAALHAVLSEVPEQRDWANAVRRWGDMRAAEVTARRAENLSPQAGGDARVPGDAAPVASPPPAPTAAADPVSVDDWASQAPSARSLSGLLQAAMAAGTLDAAAQALTAVRSYPGELVEALSPLQKGLLELLERLVPSKPVPVSDWTEWAQWWVETAPGDADRALAIAEHGAEQWDHVAWFANAGKVRDFITLLQRHSARFRPYLAIIHGSLYDGGGPAASQADLLAQMAMVVALDAARPADLPLLADWTSSLVRLGAGRALCDDLAGALHAAWGEVRSLRCLDWACDVVELLASAPRAEGGELESFFSDVIGLATAQSHRLSSVQHGMLARVARDFGLAFDSVERSRPEPATSGPVADFAGVSIGIYTLQESIVGHLRAALLDLFPRATVIFNHDHVATPSLEHMARNCSVLVFAWRCSKHQAFHCIQSHRPTGMPLLQPQGRGSASILRELTDHLLAREAVSS